MMGNIEKDLDGFMELDIMMGKEKLHWDLVHGLFHTSQCLTNASQATTFNKSQN